MSRATRRFATVWIGVLLASGAAANQQVLFEDRFDGKLGAGWSWVREHREAWRVSPRGLEVRVEPGNMWGKANDARNLLVRPAPDPAAGDIEITVAVENRPTAQYEQVDLVWYYSDSHMVKVGQELVDGKLSIVMGREENDRTRTIRIVPIDAHAVQLRFLVRGTAIQGQFRPACTSAWQDVGETDLPAPPGVRPQISLQFYQGPADVEHWARVSEFRIQRPSGIGVADRSAQSLDLTASIRQPPVILRRSICH